jgi:hypothetical protein
LLIHNTPTSLFNGTVVPSPSCTKERMKKSTSIRIIMRNLSIEVEEGETPLLIKMFLSWKLLEEAEGGIQASK